MRTLLPAWAFCFTGSINMSEAPIRKALETDGAAYGFPEETRLAHILKAVIALSTMLHCVYLHRNADPLLSDAIANWQRATGRLIKIMREPRHLHGSVDWVDPSIVSEATEAYIRIVGAVAGVGSVAGRAKRWAERKLRKERHELENNPDAGGRLAGGLPNQPADRNDAD